MKLYEAGSLFYNQDVSLVSRVEYPASLVRIAFNYFEKTVQLLVEEIV